MPGQRDVLIAIAGGVAVGLLAITFPSWLALLGVVAAIIAAVDLAHRREWRAIGALLLAAALTAGLPSGWIVLRAIRAGGSGPEVAITAIFAVSCGALILGTMLVLMQPENEAVEPEPSTAYPSAPPEPGPSEPTQESSQSAPADGATDG